MPAIALDLGEATDSMLAWPHLVCCWKDSAGGAIHWFRVSFCELLRQTGGPACRSLTGQEVLLIGASVPQACELMFKEFLMDDKVALTSMIVISDIDTAARIRLDR